MKLTYWDCNGIGSNNFFLIFYDPIFKALMLKKLFLLSLDDNQDEKVSEQDFIVFATIVNEFSRFLYLIKLKENLYLKYYELVL